MSTRYKGGVISATAPTTSISVASGVWTLSQHIQAVGEGNWPGQPPQIGQAYEGGYFMGKISTAGNGVANYYLVVGPLSTAESSSKQFKNVGTSVPGADSVVNGTQNTADMVANGNATVYPAAHFCNDLVIGGFSDWYMPAKNELELCYYNLKPGTASNNTATGSNTNAVPSRGSNYTSGTPAQTSVTVFKSGGAEAFTTDYYWSSTESSNSVCAFSQDFNGGYQSPYNYKTSTRRVRAIRRVAI